MVDKACPECGDVLHDDGLRVIDSTPVRRRVCAGCGWISTTTTRPQQSWSVDIDESTGE